MNREETENSPQEAQQTIGVFYDESTAEAAQQVLQEAGFAQDQLSIQIETPEPNQPIRETQAGNSVKGGAIIGTLFGGMVGFFIGVVTKSLPETSVSLQLNPLALALAGSGIGALGFSLMGAALGVNVPETASDISGSDSGDNLVFKYRVLLAGTAEDMLRAAETLRQRGIQV